MLHFSLSLNTRNYLYYIINNWQKLICRYQGLSLISTPNIMVNQIKTICSFTMTNRKRQISLFCLKTHITVIVTNFISTPYIIINKDITWSEGCLSLRCQGSPVVTRFSVFAFGSTSLKKKTPRLCTPTPIGLPIKRSCITHSLWEMVIVQNNSFISYTKEIKL